MNAAPSNLVPGSPDDLRWQAVFAKLLKTEGGFSDSPNDHGGATNYGLSLRFLAQQGAIDPALVALVDINHDGVIDVPDIQGMSIATAGAVYYPCFWTPAAAGLQQDLDAAVFDQTVNDGLTPAVKMLQLAVNAIARGIAPLVVDGQIGPATREAVEDVVVVGVGNVALLDAYRAQAVARYRRIAAADPTQQKWLNGWLNRAAELGDV
jgi:lysozyme family protein